MLESLKPLYRIASLNRRLFLSALIGVDDQLGQKRINPLTNNMSFVAIHVLDARYYLCRYLGDEIVNPFEEQLKEVRQVEDMKNYPALQEIKNSWYDVSVHLDKIFSDLMNEKLSEVSETKFPVNDETKLGGLAFLLQHESYHIGQMAFLRKALGRGAMKYS